MAMMIPCGIPLHALNWIAVYVTSYRALANTILWVVLLSVIEDVRNIGFAHDSFMQDSATVCHAIMQWY